jgi:hypothetical protein
MKNIKFVLAVLILTCCGDDTVTNLSERSSSRATSLLQSSPFNEYVGAGISGKLGEAWKRNYARKAGQEFEYAVNASELQEVLSLPSCIGISFVFSEDSSGEIHALSVGIDSSGKIIEANAMATRSGDVDWKTGQEWIGRFQGSYKSFFFGSQTFKRLILEKKSEVIRLNLGIDENGQYQLLLSDAADPSPTNFEDDSIKCPKFCPTS